MLNIDKQDQRVCQVSKMSLRLAVDGLRMVSLSARDLFVVGIVGFTSWSEFGENSMSSSFSSFILQMSFKKTKP